MSEYIQEDTRLINLSSKQAIYLNGQLKSSVFFDFKSVLREEPDIIYTTVGVASAQVPSSFYIINEYNNNLVTSFGPMPIYLGNYTATSLINELIPRFSEVGFGSMEITIDKITGCLTFFCAPNRIFSFLAAGSTVFSILGFENKNYYSDPYGTLKAPHPLNLLGCQQLRINSAACSTTNSNSSSLTESNLIAVIQNTAAPFGMILYNNQSSYSVLRNKRISSIDIQIMDEANNLVDFNGIDWTMTIQLTIYRRVPLPDNSKNYLRPILQTLTTIQQSLSKAPVATAADATVVEASNDENSLDVLLFNHDLPTTM